LLAEHLRQRYHVDLGVRQCQRLFSPHYSREFVTKPLRRQARRACGAPRGRGVLETVR
jgi:hypothetical protein